MTNKDREDILGCAQRLQDALDEPALDQFDQTTQIPGAEASQAACQLAIALGYCRLFGVRLSAELDGTLSAAQAKSAAEKLCRQIGEWTADAGRLGSRWENADPLEAESLCADILTCRMDAWAGMVAIAEAYHASLVDNEPRHEVLGQVFRQLVTETQTFDSALQDEETSALLSTLTATELLNNWRRLLVEPYTLSLPWWLDGTLEEMDRRIASEEAAWGAKA